MCNSRYYDVISVAVSILVGIAFSVLALFNFLTAGLLTPVLGIAFGAFCLVLLTLGAVSLLRQNDAINACVCRKGMRLLWPALLLMLVSAFTLVFALTNLVIGLILAFLLYALFTYTVFGLYCYLACLVKSGCRECGADTIEVVCR